MTSRRSIVEVTPPFIMPNVHGRYLFFQDLSKITWFKVGGPAEVMFKPKDINDLVTFIKHKECAMPITILGGGSNVLVRDGGIKGCVVKLGSGFSDVVFNETDVTVGAACLDRTVVLACAERGLAGLEFLVGVPGTIGGAVAMNAGAYGFEIKDFLNWVDMVTTDGELVRLKANDLSMSYRKGNIPDGAIIVRANFALHRDDIRDIHARINTHLQQREDSQPIRGRTGGSTFKNPADVAAWKLIDTAGCRGMTLNDAQVSTKHCNFLLNLDSATAADLEQLGEHVWQAVKDICGVKLEWEIIRLGES